MTDFLLNLNYVVSMPKYWCSMGLTTAMAMFIGVMIYEGHLKNSSKGVLSVLSYVGMVIWLFTNSSFQGAVIIDSAPELKQVPVLMLLSVSFFWILGIFIGVLIHHHKNKKRIKK